MNNLGRLEKSKFKKFYSFNTLTKDKDKLR